jgi:hypothetical protein
VTKLSSGARQAHAIEFRRGLPANVLSLMRGYNRREMPNDGIRIHARLPFNVRLVAPNERGVKSWLTPGPVKEGFCATDTPARYRIERCRCARARSADPRNDALDRRRPQDRGRRFHIDRRQGLTAHEREVLKFVGVGP